MQQRVNPSRGEKVESAGLRSWSGMRRPAAVCFVALALLAGGAQAGQQSSPATPAPVPGNGGVSRIESGQAAKKSGDDQRAERSRQLAENSAMLFKLATNLKAEVDKSTMDTLSIKVIHSAEEIERLSHNLKQGTFPTPEALREGQGTGHDVCCQEGQR